VTIDLAVLGRLVRQQSRASRLDRHQVACLADVDDGMVAIIEDGLAQVDNLPDVLAVCRVLAIDIHQAEAKGGPEVAA